MGEVLELSERAWAGNLGGTDIHPGRALVGLEEFDTGLAFMSAFSNVAVIDTAEGLVLIDTSGPFHAARVHECVRAWSDRPLHTAIYTHGHIDHVSGLGAFEAEHENGPGVRVIAHPACPAHSMDAKHFLAC